MYLHDGHSMISIVLQNVSNINVVFQPCSRLTLIYGDDGNDEYFLKQVLRELITHVETDLHSIMEIFIDSFLFLGHGQL